MAETYIMINDILEEHRTRMQNLRKYYPFFVLNETTFQQYREGRYAALDMGYLTMASLRFFLDENQFHDRPVTGEQYERFLTELLRRDFDLQEEPEAERELTAYIFDKLKNEGRPFEFHFFDPEDKKRKTARVRLIESSVRDGRVEYRITPEAIEFYLDTKEIKDESKISIQQLLLEKLISARNFRGGIDVVRRINSEVQKLALQKETVVELLSHDVFRGTEACRTYMETAARWFEEEQRLFHRNQELIGQALKKASEDDGSRPESERFYQSLEEIHQLETELKKTIRRHGELLRETLELQTTADKMIHQAKLRRLRNVFDYEGSLRRLKQQDHPAGMIHILAPFLVPRLEKQFSVKAIDNLLTDRSGSADRGEPVKQEPADPSFRYPDEEEEARIRHNYGRIFYELADQLEKKEAIELKELNAILEIRYGGDFLQNGDYYSFLVHIAQKETYQIRTLYEQPETFLENLIVEAWEEADKSRFWNLAFTLTFLEEEIPIGEDEDGFRITNIMFHRL